MKEIKNTPGGWMDFVARAKASNPGAILDYKVLMQLYLRRNEK